MTSPLVISQKPQYLLLHNIRSIHNVGSIFRTADAAGITKIFLTGYTPTPIDRFGREVKELSKVALGGELSVGWEYQKDPVLLIQKLRQTLQERATSDQPDLPLQIIGIEQDERSIDYKNVSLEKGDERAVLFIVGNEVEGMPKNVLDLCDIIAEIPMAGKKESLNVGVSLGIALFRILNI